MSVQGFDPHAALHVYSQKVVANKAPDFSKMTLQQIEKAFDDIQKLPNTKEGNAQKRDFILGVCLVAKEQHTGADLVTMDGQFASRDLERYIELASNMLAKLPADELQVGLRQVIAASKGTNLDSLIQAHLMASRMMILESVLYSNETTPTASPRLQERALSSEAVVRANTESFSEENVVKAVMKYLPKTLKECAPDLLRELGYIKPEGKDNK